MDDGYFKRLFDDYKILTAKAIKDTKADIVCLQEVENLDTLRSFESRHIKKYKYRYVIDGNDNRLIDVAVLSKFEIDTLKTHQYRRKNGKEIFSRDCLQIEMTINKKPLTLFINHFKSMLDRSAKTAEESRDKTSAKRKLQCDEVLKIIKERFPNPKNANWAVLGDFNDYMDSTSSLKKLVGSPWVENVVDRLPAVERWTHYWDTSKIPKPERYKQIDYILLSKKLAGSSKGKPVIIRKGLSTRADIYTGSRYPGVTAKVAASDHCPVVMKIKIN